MSTERIPPTPAQQRRVNIGMLIQFHLAAIGHIALWVLMFTYLLYNPHPDPADEGHFIIEIFVYQGLPISFGFLIAVYIFFRCLLAYANFGTALKIMIAFNVFHAVICCLTIIAPVRLIIPIMLYSIALYHYRTTWLSAQIGARENGEPADVS